MIQCFKQIKEPSLHKSKNNALIVVSKQKKKMRHSHFCQKIDQLKKLIEYDDEGKIIFDRINDGISHFMFVISNRLTDNMSDFKVINRQLKNFSSLYKDNNKSTELIVFDDVCSKIDHFRKITDVCTNTTEILELTKSKYFTMSYVDILTSIITYTTNLYNQCLEYQEYVQQKFVTNPTKFFDLREKVRNMVNDLCDVNLTINSYSSYVKDFEQIYLRNYIKISKDIQKNGLTENHILKISDITFKLHENISTNRKRESNMLICT